MSQQTTEPRRQYRAVEQLTAGEHVNHAADAYSDVMTWQVGHVAAYTDENTIPKVALTLTPPAGGEPVLIRERRGVTLPLATVAEVAAAEGDQRRSALALALRALANDILDHQLPVPGMWLEVRGCLDSRADVERWAKHLDGEVRPGGTAGNIPVIDAERPVLDGLRLDLHFQGPPEQAARPGTTCESFADDAQAGA